MFTLMNVRHADTGSRKANSRPSTTNAPDRSLSQVPPNVMNALNGNGTPSIDNTKPKSNSTIRSVPADRPSLDRSPQDEAARRSQTRSDPMPHSTQYLPPIPSASPHISLPRQNSGSTGLSVASSVVRRISSEFGPTRSLGNGNSLQIPEDSGPSNGTLNGTSHIASPSNSNNQQWSTAVGRSTLGKSGRVIEKLQNEIDTMRRELTSERLNTAEMKNAVGLADAKLATMREEYDIALHDAAIAKTSLKRRERQVAEMKAQIESEKQRADKAVEREKGWRDQMELIEQESKRKIEEAQMHAALMDGRVKAMTSHWKEQGAEVDRTVKKLSKEIDQIVEERRADDDRMNMLQGLCDQQAEQLTSLQAEKEAIEKKFEDYKREQEHALRDIKATAESQQEKAESKLQEAEEVLGQLKWALNVKKNVKSAQ
ncbi:hypothetical protein EG329_002971 [Mollisiaceae sp. DMI_Dod_QoI]|nr:hypothetical protein EG329_002971 [Helotiales sp. DMI_Dod_QoI]